MFKGSLVALITPFRSGGLDESAFQELVAWQVGQGTHGLVPCGTTGETPALEHDEQRRVIELCVEVAKGRAPVIAGTGSNSTAHTIEATRQAKKAGADAALIVCPYYNKPTQEGLYRHFRAVAESVAIPIVVYNIQSRTAINVETPTLARLARRLPLRPREGPDEGPGLRGDQVWGDRRDRQCGRQCPQGCPAQRRSRQN